MRTDSLQGLKRRITRLERDYSEAEERASPIQIFIKDEGEVLMKLVIPPQSQWKK